MVASLPACPVILPGDSLNVNAVHCAVCVSLGATLAQQLAPEEDGGRMGLDRRGRSPNKF